MLDDLSSQKIAEELKTTLGPDFLEQRQHEECSESLAFYRNSAGEMDAEEQESFRTHLSKCSECRRDLQFLEAQDAAPKTEGFFAGRRRFRFLAPIAALGLLLGSLWLTNIFFEEQPGEHVQRIKGAFKLQVAVQRVEDRFVARSGDEFQSGDALGFFYSSAKDGFLSVIFYDAQGNQEKVFPTEQKGAAAVKAGVEVALPDGAVVEDGQGCEWIVALFAEAKFDPGSLSLQIQEAARAAGPGCRLSLQKIVDLDVDFDVFIMRRTR